MANQYPEVIIRITANFEGDRLRGINYAPGFAVVARNQRVRFETEAGTAVLIVFPDGSPFQTVEAAENRSPVRFIVRPERSVTLQVDGEAVLRRYKYVVALKVGEQALVDGGCPEIFVDI